VDTHGNEGPTTLAFPTGTTGVVEDAPRALELGGVAPNPMTASTAVSWALPRAEAVRLVVMDLAGRRVRTLVEGLSPAGRHVDRWDARDQSGRSVASGVYFVVLEAEGRVLRSRVAVLR
jgi:flagellar hook assembly protein FlgD